MQALWEKKGGWKWRGLILGGTGTKKEKPWRSNKESERINRRGETKKGRGTNFLFG